MSNSRYHILSFLPFVMVLMLPTTLLAEVSFNTETPEVSSRYPDIVQRYYANTSRYLISHYGISIKGSPKHVSRISEWLDQIYVIPYGHDTIESILASGNTLTIISSDWALHASGRTLAPATDNLINGHGENVEILFDARIPDAGSHWVYDKANQLIEFTAVQNLYHELAHAKHLSNGTWRYVNSEQQAIEEENRFREQLGQHLGSTSVSYRASIMGVQKWQPE